MDIRKVLPVTVEEWGSLRILPAGDRIYSSSYARRTGDARDATYIRVSQLSISCHFSKRLMYILFEYELLVDKNARYHRWPVFLEKQTFYGQLEHIYTLHLSHDPMIRNPRATPSQDRPFLTLAAIRTCVIERDHPTLDIHYYVKQGGLEVVDITSVQCLVGRVKDDKGWAIIDRSGSLSRAYYIEDGDDSNDV